MRALAEARFWPALGYRVVAWRLFIRRLRRSHAQDLAVLRVERRTDFGIPYYVWITYRLETGRRGAAAVRPHRVYLPDEEDTEVLLGTPPELAGLDFFAA